MRAAILEEIGKLTIKDVPKPTPGHEEALVKISTSGVCHSDLHMVKKDWGFTNPPIPMGHEGIGIVEELGPGAEVYIQKGDRVILGLGGSGGRYWCGACEYCLSGRTMFCNKVKNLLGTYAEYISIWAKTLVKLPDEISDREVPLACGGLTAYSAIKKLSNYGITAGKSVAIIGAAGGLGHYAVQIAKAFGYKVIGVDIGPEKLAFVKKMGADYALDVNEVIPFVKKELRGVNASIVVSSKVAGFELGLKLLKKMGVLIAVGLPAASEGKMSINPIAFVLKGLRIVGSLVGSVEEMRELVQLAAEGKVKTHIGKTANLSEINQVLEDLENGTYTGRAIIDNMMK